MKWTASALALAAFLALQPLVLAQAPVIKAEKPVTGTFTIQAIDQTDRLITLRDDKGTDDIFYAGTDVKRFSELKVGQKVQMTYYETLVLNVAKPGGTARPLADTTAVTPRPGASPGGTVARQLTATVDVVAVDQAVPSITIKTASGSTITRKVENKAHLTGVKPGDRIDITYTQAALINVLSMP